MKADVPNHCCRLQYYDFVENAITSCVLYLDYCVVGDQPATATEARRLSAVTSLFSFGHKPGYLSANVGGAIRLPKVKGTLAERILSIEAVLHTLAIERRGGDQGNRPAFPIVQQRCWIRRIVERERGGF